MVVMRYDLKYDENRRKRMSSKDITTADELYEELVKRAAAKNQHVLIYLAQQDEGMKSVIRKMLQHRLNQIRKTKQKS